MNWTNWLIYEIIGSLSEEEKSDFASINTAMYSVAAVFSFKEGEEFLLQSTAKPEKKNEEPRWKQRLERKIMGLRKEADILNASLQSRIRRERADKFLKSVMKKYGMDGSRATTMKTLFAIKQKISVMGCRVRRYEKRLKAKAQNETFQKDKKAFYRSMFEDENKVGEPPSVEGIRKFWSEKIWGDANKYKGRPSWYEEVEKNYRNVKTQEWERITENEINNQLMKSMNLSLIHI